MARVKRVLFLCGRNRRRSPAAERVFPERPDLGAAAAAGLNPDADTPCTPEPLEWAEVVFAVERARKAEPSQHFGRHPRATRVLRLGIPDRHGSMDPAPVEVPRAGAARRLP